MNPNLDLPTILANHAKWWRSEPGGSWANLSRADLSSANLSRADLSSANLSSADLSGANLSSANLSRADLSGANLSSADLSGANLWWANLSGADLSGANLSGADLSGADLSGADLSSANLPNNIRWEVYLAEVVPALLQAGGKTLADVITPEVCDCHSWSNCPMHAAFGAENLEGIPALYRHEADLFIQLFDGKALTYDVLRAACGLPVEEPKAV